jgi:two-component system C4-dicarboxylate transport response regulator DctD
LLRALEAREIVPVGSSQPRHVEFRAIAAANVDLARLVDDGGFRRDLYYRLDVVRIRIPPLRERRGDVPLLFGHFIAEAERRFQRTAPRLSDRVRRRLLEHDWPGNVRELRNFADRFVLGFEAAATQLEGDPTWSLPERVQRFEVQLLRDTLDAASGDVGTAIRMLGIPRKTFYDKVRRHGLRIEEFRRRSVRDGRA